MQHNVIKHHDAKSCDAEIVRYWNRAMLKPCDIKTVQCWNYSSLGLEHYSSMFKLAYNMLTQIAKLSHLKVICIASTWLCTNKKVVTLLHKETFYNVWLVKCICMAQKSLQHLKGLDAF